MGVLPKSEKSDQNPNTRMGDDENGCQVGTGMVSIFRLKMSMNS